jgi:ABC-type bacteriocin/lantibiotic exporter with double-glycine peptidase domain
MNITSSISPVRRFFNLLKVDRQEIISIYVYALFNGIVSLSLPLGIQAIINLISGGQVSTSWIILVAFVIAGVAVTGIMQIMQLTISENLQQKILTRSAFEFAYRIPRMKLEAIDRFYVPELVNRFFDTLSVQKGLSKILLDFSSASLQVIFGLILLSFYHPFFILFSLVLVVIVYFIFQFTAPQGIRTSLKESKYKYEVAHWLEELARTMGTFKLAGNTPLPMARTDETVEGYLVARKAHFKTLLIQYINLVGFKVVIAAGLLLIGGLLVINQQMNIGQFVASEIIIILVLASVEKLILSMETIYDVLTALEKIGNVTDIPLEEDKETKIEVSDQGGLGIKLTNLSYRFEDAQDDLLKNIDLNIAGGEKICLSGFDGSGKSILLHMIAGLYDDFDGSITLDGIPINNWNKNDLHDHVNDNLANEDIFRGTLFENITMGKPDISWEEVRKIVDLVGLSAFVESMSEGYNTEILPEGKNLPRSVILRIKLARSLTGKPKLILLENHFNQLNERDKQKFINHLLKVNATVIAVSNDPRLAELFDRVVVLDKGKVIGSGPLPELESKAWYTNVFYK